MVEKFEVTGMTCSACSAHVERAVGKLAGVSTVSVNLLLNSMTVDYDETLLQASDVIAAVERAGYGAAAEKLEQVQNHRARDGAAPAAAERSAMKKRLVWSVVLLIPLMYIAMYHMLYDWFSLPIPAFMTAAFHGEHKAVPYAFTQLLFTLPILYLNRSYYQRGFKALIRRVPNMDSLIAVGSSAALLYGIFAIYRMAYATAAGDWATVGDYSMNLYFESAAMIVTLITVGKYLETRSKDRTSDAITKLMDLSPKTAAVKRDGVELEIPVEQIVVDDIIVMRPGQSVPVDGVIVSGRSSLDLSALTGESMPQDKTEGDTVPAAAINQTGYFEMRAQKVGDDTTLAQMIRLVEEAASSKAPIAALADQISRVFVPIVIAVAILTIAVWLMAGQTFEFALSTGIAVLVISCPCALGLATPVAIMVGTGKGAQLGILIRSAESLQTAYAIDTVVLDKTGTITEGKPQVTDIITAPSIDAQELLRLAASLEQPSEHPLSHAIVTAAQEKGLSLSEAVDFEATPGRGIKARIEDRVISAGNIAYMEELGVEPGALSSQAQTLSEDGKTPLYFAQDGALIGLIAVADVVKPTSKQAIKQLKRMGLKVIMLTGDNARTAEAIRKKLDIDEVLAEVLPQDKEQKIKSLQEQNQKIAMVGDGINDAPALTRADIGIAIGAGTDIAIESADIVLMKSDLSDVASAIRLSRATLRNIKQNLFWAFCYNVIGIPIAAGVFYPLWGWTLSPMFAAAAMSLSSVFVVGNALRLRFFKPGVQHHADMIEPKADQHPPALQTGGASETNTEESETNTMQRTIRIQDMTCAHCQGVIEKALKGIGGVTDVHTDLAGKKVTADTDGSVSDEQLLAAIRQAGYTPELD
ncbi:MAG: heavy metal translocating P-type ATPase [Christensenellales bacterium]|jgi:Cu+-exporting ATPase